MLNNSQRFYAGFTPDGRAILTPEFAASIREMYARLGLPAPAGIDRGRALDAAAEPDDEVVQAFIAQGHTEDEARELAALQKLYDSARGKEINVQ